MSDFNDLRFFAAVVLHGGFSAAARVLDVPKSRLSRRVVILEEQLGVRLLERNTRRIALTETGRQVYEHARAIVLEAEAVDDIVLRMRAAPRGLVRVSCPPGLIQAFERLLPEFLAGHRLLRLECVVTNRRTDLVEDGIDIAVRVRERLDSDPALQVRRLGVSSPILVASPALIATLPPLVHPLDLTGLPLLDQSEGRAGFWTLNGPAGRSETIAVEPRLATGNFQMLHRAAEAGIGIALLPEPTCMQALADGSLVQVMPLWRGADSNIHLVFTSRRGMLPSVRAVIDFLVAALTASVAVRQHQASDRP